MYICPFCQQPVDLGNPHNWQRVQGWEQKRRQGGTNALALRETKQEWAHPACVVLAKDGRGGQGRLA
jgi:hypothetical protein